MRVSYWSSDVCCSDLESVADEFMAKGQPPPTIRYGLCAVKGTGQAAIEEIIRARTEGGPYASLFDFCRRVDRHTVNRRSIEALIRAGAFDAIAENRAALLATVANAIEAAEQAERSEERSVGKECVRRCRSRW